MTELDNIFNNLPDLPDDDGLGALWVDDKPQFAPVYRMPERDQATGPKATLQDGELINYTRIVARVGYEFGVHSLTRKQWNEAGIEIVATQTGLPYETVKRVIMALQHGSPFRGIKHLIYDAKVRPLTHTGNNRNIRAMWFYDYDGPRKGRIEGRVTRLTGTWEEGHASGGYWEPPEYEPPYLSSSHRQVLYKVRDLSPDYSMERDVMVYPGDVL